MSSPAAIVCVLVLLAVTFVSARPGSFISENMRNTHESIADELKLKLPEVGRNPLFSFITTTLNNSCQRGGDVHLMNATLDVYTQIFSSILHHSNHSGLLDHLSDSKRTEVHADLTKLQRKMRELKTCRFHQSQLSHNTEKALKELKGIQVDNHLVQKKALAEFLEVYHQASVMGRCCRS